RLLFAPCLNGEHAFSKGRFMLWARVPHQDEGWWKENHYNYRCDYIATSRHSVEKFAQRIGSVDSVAKAEEVDRHCTDHRHECRNDGQPHRGGSGLPVYDRAHLVTVQPSLVAQFLLRRARNQLPKGEGMELGVDQGPPFALSNNSFIS